MKKIQDTRYRIHDAVEKLVFVLFAVIPAQAGIQFFHCLSGCPD
jgi:hypothetical protein